MYKINRKNLKILRDYIANKVSDKQFNMEKFRMHHRNIDITDGSKEKYFNTCGTVGCALGWLPHALEDANVEWEMMGFCGLGLEYLVVSDRIWDYLFHSGWSYTEYSKRKDFIERADIILGMTDEEIEKIEEEEVHPKHIEVLESGYV